MNWYWNYDKSRCFVSDRHFSWIIWMCNTKCVVSLTSFSQDVMKRKWMKSDVIHREFIIFLESSSNRGSDSDWYAAKIKCLLLFFFFFFFSFFFFSSIQTSTLSSATLSIKIKIQNDSFRSGLIDQRVDFSLLIDQWR